MGIRLPWSIIVVRGMNKSIHEGALSPGGRVALYSPQQKEIEAAAGSPPMHWEEDHVGNDVNCKSTFSVISLRKLDSSSTKTSFAF